MKEKNIFKEMHRIVAGDHMVLLYDDETDDSNVSVIVSYILSRIEKNEKCFYITGYFDTKNIIEQLKQHIDVDKVIEKGQLVILDKKDAYFIDGRFDPKKMIQLLKELSSKALDEGYNAFAITGELSWLLSDKDGFKRIMEYEYLLNQEIFSNCPISAICRYNMKKFSSSMIKNIIEVHPILIWKGQVHENPFYIDLVDTHNVDVEEYQVKSMLDTIENFTYTKSRFKNEIQDRDKQYQQLQLSVLKDMVVTLTSFLEIHDVYTKHHSQNVAKLSRDIAQNMGLSDYSISQIYYAGLVHDIGKAIIPKEIINKTDKLTFDEYETVKKHPLYAYEVLINSSELKEIATIVLQHHERWDGNGYPNGVSKNDISLEARIISIADTFDAMTSDRPYRKAFDKEIAIQEIIDNAGTQFDPEIAILAVEKVFSLN
jgi:HD-GYP domain-containing protein (c-di-GMP phosphodiesterase class II)